MRCILGAHIANDTIGIDTVISALGRDALESQLTLIKLASASPSVKWFFPSEYGTDIEYSPASAHERPHQKKLKVRAYLRTLPSTDPNGLFHTYVVTGPFADGYVAPEPAGPEGGSFDARNKRANLLGDGKGRVSLSSMREYVCPGYFKVSCDAWDIC